MSDIVICTRCKKETGKPYYEILNKKHTFLGDDEKSILLCEFCYQEFKELLHDFVGIQKDEEDK